MSHLDFPTCPIDACNIGLPHRHGTDGPMAIAPVGGGSGSRLLPIPSDSEFSAVVVEAPADVIAREHRVMHRLLRSQKLEPGSPYLHREEPPTPTQVSAVLHALADHTLIEHMLGAAPEIGADRADLGEQWVMATGIGRYLQRMGDHLEMQQMLDPTPRETED